MFAEWLTMNRGLVSVLSNEEDTQSDEPSGWYLFRVTGGASGEFLPVWDAITFGYPTIATPDITNKEDTVQKPTGDFSWSDYLTGGGGYGGEPGAFPWPLAFVAVGAMGLGYIYLTRDRSPYRRAFAY